jgi:branched-chain amino acid transport system ATP-binding protein
VRFEGVAALDSVSVALRAAEILGLIGPNGAGKTTLINVLSGFQRPTQGTIHLDAREVTAMRPHELARRGIVRTFQSARLFRALTVIENVEAAAASVGRSRRAARRVAHDLLGWLGLAALADWRAESLSSGRERWVAVARALASDPVFLLLDEPAAGLDDAECAELVGMVSALPRTFGCGILLVEHNLKVVMGTCQTLHVLDGGRTIATGATETVRRDPLVIEAYLGSKSERVRASARL